MQVGFIGLGAMGLPMTRHLLTAGHDVNVASRSRAPIDAAVAAGAREAKGPHGVVDASEVTFLCVPSSGDVVGVLDEAQDALGTGKIVVDTSTIDPDVERAQHDRVNATGARYLEAPLSGGTVGAENGTLTLMVTGITDMVMALTLPSTGTTTRMVSWTRSSPRRSAGRGRRRGRGRARRARRRSPGPSGRGGRSRRARPPSRPR